ncbi:MAG TPA: four helix bundle protein [Prolixibacteraceae bacterium]|nr:four helix bundle protein [Prolixibacteraceae bacterium]HPS13870.1 four helix bundle protein [Prolixibacteraceae bacterium]
MNNKIEKFEDLMVWQEAMLLAENIYKSFSTCKDFGFKDQIQRASVSVPSNIAEGFDRQTNKEFIQFLYISKGSASEMRTQLYLAKRLKLVDDNNVDNLLEITRKISAMLFNLIQTRKDKF